MNTEYVKIIDFILTELNKKAQYEGDSIDELLDKYQNETGIKQDNNLWDKIARICENENLIEKIGNSFLYEITPNGIDILLKYGAYTNYINRRQEIEDLNTRVSQLQVDNLEYQKTLRIKNEKIASLDLKLKRLEFIQKWWWLFGIILIIVGFVLRHLEILRFLTQ
jgi:hypothetical protein